MATISERLAYILTFDTSQGVKGLQAVGKTADAELGKTEGRLDKVAAGMQKAGAGAMAFAGVAGAGLYKLAMGAADADANMAALEQVVGETVAHQIGKWAEDSARGVGMASKDAVAAATSFAQLGKIIGLGGQDLSKFSTDLVTLSADFAAFKNVSPEQALQDIQAAFSGSTEVMRKYGIFLDDATLKTAYYRETGEKVTGTLTAQQKIVAINAEMYRQGADMIGQWGRESGEASGQIAILKAELTNAADNIGRGVLPMVTALLGQLTGLAGSFSSLSAATGGWLGKAAGIGVAMAAIGGATLFAAGKIIQLRRSIIDTVSAMRTMATTSPRMTAGMGAAAVAVAAFAAHSYTAQKNAQSLQRAIDDLERTAAADMLPAFDAILAVFTAFGDHNTDEIFAKIAREQLGAAQTALEHAKATGASQEVIDALTKAIENETKARRNAEKATEAETRALDGNTSSAFNLGKAVAEAAKKHTELGSQARRAASDIDYVSRSWDNLTGKLRDRRSFLDVQDGFDAVQRAALEAYAAARDGADDAEQKARDYERALIDQKIRVAEYMQQIKLLPAKQQTDILALIDKGEYDLVEYYLGVLSRPRTVTMTPVMRGGGGSTTLIPGSYGAEGGIVTRPTVALIGEAGPEAVVPLHKTPGSSPLPAGVGGGSNTTINVTVKADPMADKMEIGRAVSDALAQYVRNGGARPF